MPEPGAALAATRGDLGRGVDLIINLHRGDRFDREHVPREDDADRLRDERGCADRGSSGRCSATRSTISCSRTFGAVVPDRGSWMAALTMAKGVTAFGVVPGVQQRRQHAFRQGFRVVGERSEQDLRWVGRQGHRRPEHPYGDTSGSNPLRCRVRGRQHGVSVVEPRVGTSERATGSAGRRRPEAGMPRVPVVLLFEEEICPRHGCRGDAPGPDHPLPVRVDVPDQGTAAGPSARADPPALAHRS